MRVNSRLHRSLQFVLLVVLFILPQAAAAQSHLRGDLPRRDNRPLEQLPGLETTYDHIVAPDGTRLRTILTRPAGQTGKLPAILFVQWLSCDTIELPAQGGGGWSEMLRRVARESGLAMMRTEKRGVGDSEGGPCSALDYETELADHRQALQKLRQSDGVDPDKIILFGASMGANYAPLVAAREKVAGVVVWGGGAKTWFERMLTFERNFRELSDFPAGQLNSEMKQITRFLYEYLVEARSPSQIASFDPALGAVWAKIVGAEGDTHYGRPLAFHQQAQKQDWAAAWVSVQAPVLVLYGEYDWYESEDSHALIARIANRNRPGSARFRVIPQTDHHFMRFARPEDAVSDKGGTVNDGPVVEEILSWLGTVLR